MSDFFSLNRRERLAVCRRAVIDVLPTYGLDRARVRLYARGTNLIFRIDAGDRAPLVLRVATPGWRSRENLVSEALWLEALERETDIPAPRVIRTKQDEHVATARSERFDLSWVVTVMSYQPGRRLGAYLTERNLRRMGVLFAELHRHGAEWERPPDFCRQVFDRLLSRGEPCTFFEHPEWYETSGDLDLLVRTAARVEAAYAALDRGDIRVIHCDLWHDNIKLHHGRLLPFDFEDTILGFRLHDIGMAMLDLLEDTDAVRYPVLLRAFRAGYETLFDWPEGDMDALQAGRLLWVINHVARFERPYLSKVIEQRRPMLEAFDAEGRILPGKAGYASSVGER